MNGRLCMIPAADAPPQGRRFAHDLFLVECGQSALFQQSFAAHPDIADLMAPGAVYDLAERVIDRLGGGLGQVDGDEVGFFARDDGAGDVI